MQVGVNYPWFDYGWDFGLGPEEWRGGRVYPRWYGEIDRHLDRFCTLGISVVRWFILADALTYGSAQDAPQIDALAPTGWRFDPPPIGQDALEHFNELLARFDSRASACRIQLLPVFIDFHFCLPGTIATMPDMSWIKRGRADAIIEENKRERFLDSALEPLLQISRQYPDVIYAWEVMNEPDWITRGWQHRMLTPRPLDRGSMTAFLGAATNRIRRAGFKATIGFASPAGLERSGIAVDINQFHHYPGGRRWLEPHTFDSASPCIIGEFATASADVWPELDRSAQTVSSRLQLAARRAYPLALPWSFLSNDRHTQWSQAVERDIEVFVKNREGG